MSLSQYMIIGQYVPGDSFIHRLDPRSKLLFIFFVIFLVFFIQSIHGYLLLLGLILFAMVNSKVPFLYYVRGITPILWMILFTTILHLTMTEGGEIVFQWRFFVIYTEGILKAVYIAIRLLMLVLIASILTLTTSPIDLTMGLERLLYPLTKVRVPVHELALMMSITLRFIPTLLDETEKVMKAQKARGAKFETGPIHIRMKHMVAIIIPLFISAFKRADELANAMEARGYRDGIHRTRLRVTYFTWRDGTLVIILLFVLTIILLLKGF